MKNHLEVCIAKASATKNWVDGAYYKCNDSPNGHIFFSIDINGVPTITPVILETICMCTGLKDKNNRYIYEKDIIEVAYPNFKEVKTQKLEVAYPNFKEVKTQKLIVLFIDGKGYCGIPFDEEIEIDIDNASFVCMLFDEAQSSEITVVNNLHELITGNYPCR